MLNKDTDSIDIRQFFDEVDEENTNENDVSSFGMFGGFNSFTPIKQSAVEEYKKQASITDDLSKGMAELSFFDRAIEEYKINSNMGTLSREISQINKKRLANTATEQDLLKHKEKEKELSDYFASRENEDFLLGSFRAMNQNFVPYMKDLLIESGKGALYAGAALATVAGVGAAIGLTGGTALIPIGTALTAGAGANAFKFNFEELWAENYANLSEIEDITRDKAIEARTARRYSFAAALPQAVLEQVSLGKAAKLIMPPSLIKLGIKGIQKTVESGLSAGVSKAIGQGAKNTLVSLATEVATEVAQEGISIISEDIARLTSENVFAKVSFEEKGERLKDTAYETFKSIFLPIGVGGGVLQTRHQVKQYKSSLKTGQAIQVTIEGVKKNEFIKEHPEQAKEYFAQALENNNTMQTMYFPAEQVYDVLFQSEEGIQLAKKLGVSPEILYEALELDEHIAIATEKALGDLFTSEYGQGLEKHAKYDVKHYNRAEIENIQQELTEDEILGLVEIDDSLDGRLGEIYESELAVAELENIAEPYISQLIEIGYTEEQSKAYGHSLASHAQVMANITGESPKEYLQNRLLGINQEDSYKAQALAVNEQYQGETKNNTALDWTNKFERTPTIEEVKAHINELFNNGLQYATLSPNWFIDLKGGYNKKDHVIKSSQFSRLNTAQKNRHNQYLVEIEELINNAEYTEGLDNTKKDKKPNVEKYHYFSVPIQFGDKVFDIRLITEEYKDDNTNKPQTVHLYDVIEKKQAFSQSAEILKSVNISQEEAVENNISSNAGDVKNLYQEKNQKPRGLISINQSNQAIITLFKDKKNLSTVLHETGHLFLMNLQEAYFLENPPDWIKESFETMGKELGFSVQDKSIPVEAQEKFARLAEAYFREGKAPSKSLESAFSHFKDWLVAVYKKIEMLIAPSELSDEVRNVFDRLLATEAQLEEAKSELLAKQALPELQEVLNIPDEQIQAYNKSVKEGLDKAKRMAHLYKLAKLGELEKEARAEAREEISESKFYSAIEDIRKAGKISLESLVLFVNEDHAQELKEKWNKNIKYKQLISDKGTLSMDDAAAYLELLSGQELLTALINEVPENMYIKNKAEVAVQNFEAMYSPEIEFMNESTDSLSIEIEALGGTPITKSSIKNIIEHLTGVKKGSEIDQEYKLLKNELLKQKYLYADLIKQIRKETNLEAKNKLIRLKQQEQVKRQLLRKYYKDIMRRGDIIRNVKKIANSKTIPDLWKQQILQLVELFKGLGTPNMQAREGTPALMSFISAMYATDESSPFAMLPPQIPEWIDESSRKLSNVKEISAKQLEEVYSLIQQLAHIGRNENKLIGEQSKKKVQKTVESMLISMNNLKGKKSLSDIEKEKIPGKLLENTRGAISSISLISYMMKRADGFLKDGKTGENFDNIYKPLHLAKNTEISLLDEYSNKFSAIWGKIQKETNFNKEFVIEGIPFSDKLQTKWQGRFTMERVIAITMNLGNEGNLKAVMKGYGWSKKDIQTIVAQLSQEQLEAVQKTWDLLEELRPHLDKVYSEVNGVPMSKVKASQIQVQDKLGNEITLKGGYYPLHFDAELAPKINEKQITEDMLNENAFIHNMPTTRKGMTIERTGASVPPLLSFSKVISRHFTDSIKYIAMEIPVRNSYMLIKNEDYKQGYTRAFSEQEYNQLIPYLKSIARVERASISAPEKIADYLTRMGSIYAMGFSLGTAFKQLSSIPISMSEIGFWNFNLGAMKVITHPLESYRLAKEISPTMANRIKSRDKTLLEHFKKFKPNAYMVRIGKIKVTYEQFASAAFAFTAMFDMAVALPTFWGKYNADLAKGIDHKTAVTNAELAVDLAQATGKDISSTSLMREKGAYKFLTMFMSFAMNWQNRQRQTIAGYKEYLQTGNSETGHAEFFKSFALEWIMPAVITVTLMSLREKDGPEPKDLAEELFSYWIMGFPFVRETTSVFYGRNFGSSVAFTGGEALGKAGVGLYNLATDQGNENTAYNTMKNIINAGGFFTKIPTNAAFRYAEGTVSYLEGEAGLGAMFLGKPYNKGKSKKKTRLVIY